MKTTIDTPTNANFTLLHHYVSRRFLLKAMGFFSLGMVPFISSCGDVGAGQNAKHPESKNSTPEAVTEQPKAFSKLPLIDMAVPPQIETATFAMG